jgi:protein SCO1/2
MSERKPRSAWQNLLIAFAATVSLVGGYYLGNLASPKQPELNTATLIPDPRPLEDFRLIDANGQPFTLDNLKGHWNLMFFGYTNCPDICPTALTSMVEVNKALSADAKLASQIQTVFISVDPKRDTPEHLKAYVGFFDPDFVAATGEDSELRRLSKQLALSYNLQTPDQNGDYLVDHSAWLIVVNPAGEFHAVISGSHFPNPRGMADDIAIITDIY